jgi:SAM-dependent methyltransferase
MTRLIQDYKLSQNCKLVCSDFSEGMIEQVREVKGNAVKDNATSPWSRVETMVQNAMDLKDIPDGSQSHVTAGWVSSMSSWRGEPYRSSRSQVYFMTPDPQKCLTESLRVLKDGGVLACSSWQGSQWMDLMMLTPQIRPDKKNPSIPDEWTSAENMKVELEKAGFKDVESVRVPTSMSFESREAMVSLCLDKMPIMRALTADLTEDEMARLRKLMDKEMKKMTPDEPGVLEGVALVAVGRK